MGTDIDQQCSALDLNPHGKGRISFSGGEEGLS
jgi:hypothetical protein